MSKTYRALMIVTFVATLASLALQLTYGLVWVSGWHSYAPLGGSVLAPFIVPLWLTTSALAAPVVGVFSVVVATQARRWRWLVALTLLGLLGAYGPTLLSALGPIIDSALSFHAMELLESIYTHALPLILLAIAALLFVATTSRPARMHSDQASEAAV